MGTPAAILEILRASFPAELKDEVAVVMGLFAGASCHSPTIWGHAMNLPEGQVQIPYRIYFPEPSPEALEELTTTQTAILACIMTRHHSGYVRESWAARLCSQPEVWTTPFVALLPGDYVVQIVTRIEPLLTAEWVALSREFAAANPEFRKRLSQRIVTYWDIYYRQSFPKFREHPAYQVAEALGLWAPKTARRITRKG